MILDGNMVAKRIKRSIKEQLEGLEGRKPGLAVVIVGSDPRSLVYVKSKERTARKAGFISKIIAVDEGAGAEAVKEKLTELNKDSSIDGVLLQIPLPKGYNESDITGIILPEKDVDGLHPCNLGRLLKNEAGHVPCTPKGIIRLLDEYGIEIRSKRVLIIGRSNIVGKPLFHLFLKRDATVTVAHTKTLGLDRLIYESDILVSAVGKPFIIRKGMVRKESVLIDVGINTLAREEYERFKEVDIKREKDFREKGYTIVGDMDYDQLVDDVSYITPVPGGVGPLTVAMLLQNTLDAYLKR